MAYSEKIAQRIRLSFEKELVTVVEKKMMGGICFMVNDKMCAGVIGENLMARIDPDIYDEALQKKGCSEMNFTGKPMKGFVFVNEDGIGNDKELSYWIKLCLEFNPKAKSGKKKKKK